MKRAEDQIHKAVVHFLRSTLPHGWLIHHSPNGGKRSAVEGAIFKAFGTIAGWPDITVLGEAAKGCQCWFFEVKRPGGVLSQNQRAVIDKLRDLGFPVAVIHSIEEAEQAARLWGLPLRGGLA